MNIGLLAGASYAFYVQPRLRHDTKVITSALAAAFVLFRAESYTAKACRSTFWGKASEREVEERPLIYHRSREHMLRPWALRRTIGFGEFVLHMSKLGPISISGGQLTSVS